jgi:hypothetical protein
MSRDEPAAALGTATTAAVPIVFSSVRRDVFVGIGDLLGGLLEVERRWPVKSWSSRRLAEETEKSLALTTEARSHGDVSF